MDYTEAKSQEEARTPLWLKAFIYGLFHPPSMDTLIQTDRHMPWVEPEKHPTLDAKPYDPRMQNNYHVRRTIEKTSGEGCRGRK